MSKIKKVLILLVVVLVVIQFIRPERNNGAALSDTDITHSVTVPKEVMDILQTSCYDCHSNHTEYPWYCNIQPVGLWTAHHVNEGKEEVNFSEFNTYSLKRKLKKLKEIKEQLEDQEMPLSSFTLIHKDAIMNEAQIGLINKWADESKVALEQAQK